MQTITAVVETPKNSAQKYDYDPDNKGFKLKKLMPAGMVFPFDFGFIPHTLGEDGDPLDIIIISEFRSFPGCIMDCRVIGAITANQTEKGKTIRNDRFISVPEASQMFADIKGIKDLPHDVIDQLETFFINYNELEGKKFRPLKRLNAQQAFKLIKPK
ncbi:MAG TPA: inorganic diphosphatase [Parafilimonas sp.]|nr:inorganic diphosphatase [Parafilimonas sp.]